MSTPAGWYPDTERPGEQRYWDGESWTEHRAPASDASLAVAQRPSRVLKFILWTLAVVFLGIPALLIALFAIGGFISSGDADVAEPTNNSATTPKPTPLATENPARVMKWLGSSNAAAWRDYVAEIDSFNADIAMTVENGTDPEIVVKCEQAGYLGIGGTGLMKSPSEAMNGAWDEVTSTYIEAGAAKVVYADDPSKAADACVASLNEANDHMEVVVSLLEEYTANS